MSRKSFLEQLVMELKEMDSRYCKKTIDLERCPYIDFGNGYNVEISGCADGRSKGTATLYLWEGDTAPGCRIIRTERGVERSAEGIHKAVKELEIYLKNRSSQPLKS